MSDTENTTAPEETAAPDVAPIEVHAKARGMSEWLFNAVKAFHLWPIGKVMSADDFDAAVKTVTTHRFG